jgi:hypothetical protein
MRIITLAIACICFLNTYAQNPEEDKIRTTNLPEFKKLKMTDIPGAVKLSQPQWIRGTEQDIRIEKHGLIYPALFDWNKDGKKDLLLGEFETSDTLSNIKVYINEGTKKKPKFTGKYFYATDINGNRIANSQWCCIGIHPRLVDITGDGYLDIVSGQYNPGAISLWRGSKDGFLPREFVQQEGWQVDERSQSGVKEARHRTLRGAAPWEPGHLMYWNYTTTEFADFNGDGLLDLFSGSSSGMRVALNIGTKETPKFGIRQDLYHVNGDILTRKKPTEEMVKRNREMGEYTNYSGTGKAYLKPIDWDNDGVLDILMTGGYYEEGYSAVHFYKGVQTDKGLRFKNYVPLFKANDGSKELPGVQPMLTVADYNNDGINDLVIGVSVPTVNGFEADDKTSWGWNRDFGIQMPGKDAGRAIKYSGGFDKVKEKIEKNPAEGGYYMGNLKDFKYLTLRHRGYVFVMYGSKSKSKAAKAQKVIAGKAFKPKKIEVDTKLANKYEKVSYELVVPKRLGYRGGEAVVKITFDEGWHGYVDNEANKKNAFIPTHVSFNWPEWLEPIGEIQLPKASIKGGAEVYKGTVEFKQRFKVKRLEPKGVAMPGRIDFANATDEEKEAFQKQMNKYQLALSKLPNAPLQFELGIDINWQTCDKNICLPPETVSEKVIVKQGR